MLRWPSLERGRHGEAKRSIRQNLETSLKEDCDFVVSIMQYVATLKEYARVFSSDTELKEMAHQFSKKVIDLNKFIVDYLLLDNGLKALNNYS